MAAMHDACARAGHADTKIEFGLVHDNLTLIDEVFTPDSSRYWAADQWEPGTQPTQYDKQIIRDALEATSWDKTAPAPELPPEILSLARERYLEIHEKLTGRPLA